MSKKVKKNENSVRLLGFQMRRVLAFLHHHNEKGFRQTELCEKLYSAVTPSNRVSLSVTLKRLEKLGYITIGVRLSEAGKQFVADNLEEISHFRRWMKPKKVRKYE